LLTNHFPSILTVVEQKAEEETAAAVERASASAAKVEDGAISFDDTSEFVRSIATQPIVQVIRTSRNTSLPVASSSLNAVASSSMPQVKTEEQDVDLNAMMDVPMSGLGDEDGEEDDEDKKLALAALRQGMSVAEMREKMDAELVKEEEEDTSVRLYLRFSSFLRSMPFFGSDVYCLSCTSCRSALRRKLILVEVSLARSLSSSRPAT
jgi:hypothetical protein